MEAEKNLDEDEPVASGEFGELDSAEEIELPPLDVSKYIGQDNFIESIEERKGQYGFYVKVLSKPVDEGQKEIRASKIFGLMQDENKKWGWGPKSALGLFLKKHKVTHYKNLVGSPQAYEMKKDEKSGETYRRISGTAKIKIKIQTRTSKADGRDYLTF